MTGQDAVNIAKAFVEKIALTGLILTRADGDARGGAALSMRYITQCPIKFLGVGEHVDQLIPFHPQKIADSILDKGDILDLLDKVSKLGEASDFEKSKKRLESGRFDFNDMHRLIDQFQQMGGAPELLKMLPGGQGLIRKINDASQADMLSAQEQQRHIALIQSMTKKERRNPDLLNASRKKRIATGAGQTVVEVNKLLKKFQMLKTVAKTFSSLKGGKGGKMRSLLSGKLPF
jgi:signal recognition particle subunit SRP54